MSVKAQKAYLWTAVAGLVLFGIGLYPLLQVIPPIDPSDSGEQLVQFYTEDVVQKRIGIVVTFVSLTLTAPLVCMVSAHLRRIEGDFSPLSWMQMVGFLIGMLPGTVIPLTLFGAFLFRGERDPDTLLLMHDFTWINFTLFLGGVVEVAAIGLGAFRDTEQKVFPRWFGYMSLWAALSFFSGALIIFFTHGPLAWNGAFAFWLPLTILGIYFATLIVLLFKAAPRMAQEEQDEADRELREREILRRAEELLAREASRAPAAD